MPGLVDAIVGGFSSVLVKALGSLLAAGLVALLTHLFGEQAWTLLRRITHYAFDTKVNLEVTRVDRYESPPVSSLDQSSFKSIQSEIESATFEALDDNRLRISVDGLTSQLEIRLEEQVAPGNPHISDRYEVKIETFTPLTFGYRSDQCLREFERVSDTISKTIQTECFSGSSPESSFVTGTLHGQTAISEDEIEDESVGLRIQNRPDSLELTIEDPQYLSQGVRKYFKPG